ncbi:hypothetical protein EDI_004730 [Entamoeba dispar SAW760]|uniref:Uncharacterized protein n=1 Tax=Entamoeba dispar (strain ATCC PRA-260 / SAW760) TaxID=370354 RepID=B0E8Z8_ENTDS|nr:uncharacterized protein EDI_004730 [Entamoeba dispar SAW760]EDR29012.1 hypothetical protein EDI_004730 [Entamoeba dispar SAW760]|eukprot:EDR29012.1 hypothetical protein EDI_004730 [Entamoeba dispar SAW760]
MEPYNEVIYQLSAQEENKKKSINDYVASLNQTNILFSKVLQSLMETSAANSQTIISFIEKQSSSQLSQIEYLKQQNQQLQLQINQLQQQINALQGAHDSTKLQCSNLIKEMDKQNTNHPFVQSPRYSPLGLHVQGSPTTSIYSTDN